MASTQPWQDRAAVSFGILRPDGISILTLGSMALPRTALVYNFGVFLDSQLLLEEQGAVVMGGWLCTDLSGVPIASFPILRGFAPSHSGLDNFLFGLL